MKTTRFWQLPASLIMSAAVFAGVVQADPRPDSHAPIAVMGDHTHNAGEWMLSYRFMTMDMEDNLQGDQSVTPEHIVMNLANPNSPPMNVRVVPTSMTTDMHMFGLMYAPSDKVTLMAMINLVEKQMDHITFMGMMGTERLGTFTTESSGLGDTKLSALVSLFKDESKSLHLNLGVSLPTGSIDEEDQVLTPMGMQTTLRLPYGMQLGSGTYDLEPGITYSHTINNLVWGAQYLGTLRLSDNDENYTFGDVNKVSAWTSYRFAKAVSGSLRLTYRTEDEIDGRDVMIMAPVQTANPANYGGDRFDLGVGINIVSHTGHRFALEYELPIEQDVNGVQLEMQSMLTLGYQYAF